MIPEKLKPKLNMTIGEIYNPLIKFAENQDSAGYDYIEEVGRFLFENNKDKCKSVQQGIVQAMINLDYYCQYFSPETAIKVKEWYNLGKGFRSLTGKTDTYEIGVKYGKTRSNIY